MIENLAEFYYSQLSETSKPGTVLNRMYKELFGSKLSNKDKRYVDRIITFNKLVKLYGRYEVYFALLDMANWARDGSKFDVDTNPYPIVHKFVVSRLEKKYASRSDSFGVDLESLVKRVDKIIKERETKELNIPETFHNGDKHG